MRGGKPLKKDMRRQWIEERKNIPPEEKERAGGIIGQMFLSQEEYKNSDAIFIYVSMKNEVPTADIINRALKDGKTDMVKNSLGVYEPQKGIEDEIIPSGNTLLVVPGTAFDIQGGRMGYGGGYYDTYIEKYGIENTLALAFDIQIKERVPREPHDKLMKKIITEKRTITVL